MKFATQHVLGYSVRSFGFSYVLHRTMGRVSPALESWGDACLLAIALRLAAAEAAEWRAHLSEGRG